METRSTFRSAWASLSVPVVDVSVPVVGTTSGLVSAMSPSFGATYATLCAVPVKLAPMVATTVILLPSAPAASADFAVQVAPVQS